MTLTPQESLEKMQAAADDDSVTPVEPAVTESNPPADDDFLPINPISTYRPRGTARGSPEYYRMSYKKNGKVRHVHIRGGNTDSPIAQAKVQEVRSLLAAGVTIGQIVDILKSKIQ